jgi:hypothetical protein
LRCFWLGHNVVPEACKLYLESFGGDFGSRYVKKELDLVNPESRSFLEGRALSAPATTGNATWAAPLVGVEVLVDGFLAVTHSASLLGRIPGIRRIPFQTRVPTEDQSPNFGWVAEAGVTPVVQAGFGAGVTLGIRKVAGIVAFTQELVTAMPPGAEAAMRDTLVNALVHVVDKSFIDPASGEIVNTRPKSITSGVTPTPPGADFAASVAALLDAFFAGRPGAQAVSIIAAPRQAARLRVLNGGAGPGFPIVETDAAGTAIVVVDGRAIVYCDGGVEVSVSDAAAVQMNTTPDDPPSATTVIVSLWQENLVGFRPVRAVNWSAQAGAVQYLA